MNVRPVHRSAASDEKRHSGTVRAWAVEGGGAVDHTGRVSYSGSLLLLVVGMALTVLGAFAWPGLIGEALVVVGLVGLAARFVTSRIWRSGRVD